MKFKGRRWPFGEILALLTVIVFILLVDAEGATCERVRCDREYRERCFEDLYIYIHAIT